MGGAESFWPSFLRRRGRLWSKESTHARPANTRSSRRHAGSRWRGCSAVGARAARRPIRSVRVNSPTAAGRPPLDWAVLNRQALVCATPSPSRNGQAGRSHRAGRNLGGTAQAARLACAAASEEGVLPGLGGGHRRSGRHAGGQGEGRVAKGCAAPERAVPAREARPDPLALRVAASMDLTDFMLTG